MSEWMVTTVVLAVLVYIHAVYWQQSHGPIRSFWLRRERGPMRCAIYVLLSGGLGAIEYAILCLLSRTPSRANERQSDFESSLRATPLSNDRDATKEYWDQQFTKGLDSSE